MWANRSLECAREDRKERSARGIDQSCWVFDEITRARYPAHDIEFKRQAQEYLSGGTHRCSLKRHNIKHQLSRVLVRKRTRGRRLRHRCADSRSDSGIRGTDRCSGAARRQAGTGIGVSRERALKDSPPPRIRHHWPHGISVTERCRLMNIVRSTWYDRPKRSTDDTAIVKAILATRDEFEVRAVCLPPRRRSRALEGIAGNHMKTLQLLRSATEDSQALRHHNRRRSSRTGQRISIQTAPTSSGPATSPMSRRSAV